MTDLLYSDIEESLRHSVRGTLDRLLNATQVALLADSSDYDPAPLWRQLATDLGLGGLLIPESFGGSGATAREAAVVLEELGRTVAPVPFLTSSVIAASTLIAAGDETALPEIASGERTAVLVLPWTARAGHWQPVTGSVQPVAGAVEAELFVVPRIGDGEIELQVYENLVIEPLTSLDMSRQLAIVTVEGDGRVIATGADARRAVEAGLQLGGALLASEQFALAQWCLEATVEYAKTRIQFARPIGSFQAIKHRLADLYLEVVQAQAVARYAADTAARDDADAPIARTVAQSYCSQAAVHAAEEALQLHGGIGMTWEHPIHLYLKRAKANQLALGTPAANRSDLAELVSLPV